MTADRDALAAAIEAMRREYPENGPLGGGPLGDAATELARVHRLASHRLTVMTDLKREVGALQRAALAAHPTPESTGDSS